MERFSLQVRAAKPCMPPSAHVSQCFRSWAFEGTGTARGQLGSFIGSYLISVKCHWFEKTGDRSFATRSDAIFLQCNVYSCHRYCSEIPSKRLNTIVFACLNSYATRPDLTGLHSVRLVSTFDSAVTNTACWVMPGYWWRIKKMRKAIGLYYHQSPPLSHTFLNTDMLLPPGLCS